MPTIIDLTIKDGAATPVDHVFSVETTNGRQASWNERSAPSPAGYLTLNHEVRKPTSAGAAGRVLISGYFPKMEVVNGINTVTRFSSVKAELNFPILATEQERADALAYLVNFLNQASVKTSVLKMQPFY